MKSWKEYSLYHVIKTRRANKYLGKGKINFLSGICKQERLAEAIATISVIILLASFTIFSLGISAVIGLSSYILMSLILAITDTTNMYNYRVRQNTIKSVNRILGLK